MESDSSTLSSSSFLEECQKYPALYDKFNKDYKDKYIKVNCWKKIGEKFNLTPEEAEKKFKSFRTMYGRYMRNLKKVPSGSGREAVPELPKELQSMAWIQPHIVQRKTAGNFCQGDCDESSKVNLEDSENTDLSPDVFNVQTDSLSVEDADNEEEENLSVSEECPVDLTPSTSKKDTSSEQTKTTTKRAWSSQNKKAAKQASISPVEEALLKSASSLAEHVKQASEAKKQKMSEKETPESGISLYCKSLVPRFEKLNPRAMSFMRIQIEQLFFQAEFGGLGHSTTPHNPPQHAIQREEYAYHQQGDATYLQFN